MNMMYVFLPLATLLYIVVDLYAEIKSFPALLRSVSFWLLWLLFTVLNAVSFILLRAAAPAAISSTQLAPSTNLLILFFSTIGTFSIIQSFSLKFAGYKAIDLEQTFEKLRAGVLEEAGNEKADLARARILTLARRLTAHYTVNPASLDADYALAVYNKAPAAQIDADIALATANPSGKIATLVNRMVFTDERGARQFLP